MVPAMVYELFRRNVRPLVYVFHFAFGVVAGMYEKNELKLDLLLGSNFHSRLERCVTNAPFVV